jgi:hypothetical protein
LYPLDHRIEPLQEALYTECRARRIVPPTPERVTRIARSALRTFETRFYVTTMRRLSAQTRLELDALLVDAERIAEIASQEVAVEHVAVEDVTGARDEAENAENAEKGESLTPKQPDDEAGASFDAGSLLVWEALLNDLDAELDAEFDPARETPSHPHDASSDHRRTQADALHAPPEQPAPRRVAAPSDPSRRLTSMTCAVIQDQ